MNYKLSCYTLLFCLFLPLTALSQSLDLTAVYVGPDDSRSQLLFSNEGLEFGISNAFHARNADLNAYHPRLSVSGDFTGDGLDEIAFFDDLLYTPNMNPHFTCSVVLVGRSDGEKFIPSGTWFSTLDTELDFNYVSFSVSGDYNLDGLDDIALFYNDPTSDLLSIYLLESTGSGFSEAQTWYSVNRNDFNFTAIKFACVGDFNGNGKPDLAVFYNYFGTAPETKQSIFLFESEGNSFTLLPVAYETTKASYDFTAMKFAFSGDYNLDGYSDVAVLLEDPIDLDLIATVFEGTGGSQVFPTDYTTIVDSEPRLSNVLHAAGGNFTGDTATDIALFYDNQGTGNQEILVLESDLETFKAPVLAFSAAGGEPHMADITAVLSGTYSYKPLVKATTWKDDMKGAVSFTFDDGYRGAFEYGGAVLETAGLKGTFYIFTDTSAIYDGELASTALVKEYKDKGHQIASHTANHSNLGFITASGDMDSLTQLLSGSVEELNERFDQYTTSMSIPFGSFRYETLGYISQYFYTARSSQFGFNLATPYDFYALKSWPILSTTSPAYVDNLLSTAETFGTYLPLMYHDMLDEPFDEDSLIYTYSRELFSQTVQDALDRELWIDTHERVYKYIRQRNALKITYSEIDELGAQPGYFSFEADDGLVDSVFNMELTLKISLPSDWTEDSVRIGPEDEMNYMEVQQDSLGAYIYYNFLPQSGVLISVYDGKYIGTGFLEHPLSPSEVKLLAAPNPFQHETIITASGNHLTDGYIIVRDIHGRIILKIKEHSDNSFHLPRNTILPGIYIIQLINSGKPIASIKLMAL